MVKKQKGFTLVEILVATFILVTVGVISSQIFFTLLKSSQKSDILREVKQNGDYAISIMGRMVKNAQKVTSTCNGSGQSSLTILNPDGATTQFSLSGTQIASTGGLLTNDKVSATNLSFICRRTAGRPDIVGIGFTLSQLGTPSRVEEKASVNFQTTVSLRTYQTR